MELAFVIAYYLLIKSIGTTVGNTAALLQGKPVQVARKPVMATGGAASAGGAPPVATSYTGRAAGTVAAVVKESAVDGWRTGWATGQAAYAARQDKRAAKKAAKAGAGGDAPVLDTVPADDTAPANSTTAVPTGGAQESGQPVLDIPAVPGEWRCRNCGESAGGWHCEACRVCVIRAKAHLPGCPVVEREKAAAEEWERERARRRAAAEAAQQQPTPDKTAADPTGTTPAEPAKGSEAAEKPAGAGESEERPGRGTVLFLVPRPGGEQAVAAAEPLSVPSERLAPAVSTPPTFGGVMTTTVSSETTTIGSTRAFLAQLATYTGDGLSELETADATLRRAEMDAETLGHMAAAAEHFAAAKAALEAALSTMNSKHGLMEEAVQSTPDAAQRDFYKE